MKITQRTQNILAWYYHLWGESTIPRVYQQFAFLSAVSACVGDRVWFERYIGTRLHPNIYVMLVGESASGKGTAALDVLRMINDFSPSNEYVKVFAGPTTSAHFIDWLGKDTFDQGSKTVIVPSTVCWVVHDELRADLGNKRQADEFIKMVTKLYTTSPRVDTGTRTHGHVSFPSPCISWLAATTEDWLLETIDQKDLRGGFGSRVCMVYADLDTRRIAHNTNPPDYEEVRRAIQGRLIHLTQIPRDKGKFWWSPEAMVRYREWLLTRPNPEEKDLRANWKRQEDLVLKIAMLLSLCSAPPPPLVIERIHINQAIYFTTQLLKASERSLELAAKNPQVEKDVLVMEALKGYEGQISHTKFADRMRKKGVSAVELRRYIEIFWRDGKINRTRTPSGGMVYEWIKD